VTRLAIFIDGGYIDKVAREFQVRPDFGKVSTAIASEVGRRSVGPVELLRTFYYHCPPYQSARPTEDESKRYGQARAFFEALGRLPRYEVRLGRLALRGLDANGAPIFQQKRVDLLLGLDFALLAGKHQIAHAAVVSGDSDLIPAVTVAKQEGVCVWLVHGPRGTYAAELWDAADERIELDKALMEEVARGT
jgi:uncharacterized LabA/DUF88 family protein